MYGEMLDRILTYFAESHPSQMARVKAAFFEVTGEVYEDDTFLESRLQSYLEWFLFHSLFENGPLTPIEHYVHYVATTEDPDDRATLDALCHVRYSLFEFKKHVPKRDVVVLYDWVTKEKLEVTERRSMAGFAKGDLFEARLMEKFGQFFFLTSFLQYPNEANRWLKKQIKALHKQGVTDFRPFLLTLQRLWTQKQRYAHVPVKRVFDDLLLEKYYVRQLPFAVRNPVDEETPSP